MSPTNLQVICLIGLILSSLGAQPVLGFLSVYFMEHGEWNPHCNDTVYVKLDGNKSKVTLRASPQTQTHRLYGSCILNFKNTSPTPLYLTFLHYPAFHRCVNGALSIYESIDGKAKILWEGRCRDASYNWPSRLVTSSTSQVWIWYMKDKEWPMLLPYRELDFELLVSTTSSQGCEDAICNDRGSCTLRSDSPPHNLTTFNSDRQIEECHCSKPYGGPTCSEVIIPKSACTDMPCLNQGLCIIEHGSTTGYYCQCVYPYNGRNCEFNTAICLPNSGNCGPHGACVGLRGRARCVCLRGWIGVGCDTRSPCLDSPCLNNGECIAVSATSVSCICKPAWTGHICNVSLVHFRLTTSAMIKNSFLLSKGLTSSKSSSNVDTLSTIETQTWTPSIYIRPPTSRSLLTTGRSSFNIRPSTSRGLHSTTERSSINIRPPTSRRLPTTERSSINIRPPTSRSLPTAGRSSIYIRPTTSRSLPITGRSSFYIRPSTTPRGLPSSTEKSSFYIIPTTTRGLPISTGRSSFYIIPPASKGFVKPQRPSSSTTRKKVIISNPSDLTTKTPEHIAYVDSKRKSAISKPTTSAWSFNLSANVFNSTNSTHVSIDEQSEAITSSPIQISMLYGQAKTFLILMAGVAVLLSILFSFQKINKARKMDIDKDKALAKNPTFQRDSKWKGILALMPSRTSLKIERSHFLLPHVMRIQKASQIASEFTKITSHSFMATPKKIFNSLASKAKEVSTRMPPGAPQEVMPPPKERKKPTINSNHSVWSTGSLDLNRTSYDMKSIKIDTSSWIEGLPLAYQRPNQRKRDVSDERADLEDVVLKDQTEFSSRHADVERQNNQFYSTRSFVNNRLAELSQTYLSATSLPTGSSSEADMHGIKNGKSDATSQLFTNPLNVSQNDGLADFVINREIGNDKLRVREHVADLEKSSLKKKNTKSNSERVDFVSHNLKQGAHIPKIRPKKSTFQSSPSAADASLNNNLRQTTNSGLTTTSYKMPESSGVTVSSYKLLVDSGATVTSHMSPGQSGTVMTSYKSPMNSSVTMTSYKSPADSSITMTSNKSPMNSSVTMTSYKSLVDRRATRISYGSPDDGFVSSQKTSQFSSNEDEYSQSHTMSYNTKGTKTKILKPSLRSHRRETRKPAIKADSKAKFAHTIRPSRKQSRKNRHVGEASLNLKKRVDLLHAVYSPDIDPNVASPQPATFTTLRPVKHLHVVSKQHHTPRHQQTSPKESMTQPAFLETSAQKKTSEADVLTPSASTREETSLKNSEATNLSETSSATDLIEPVIFYLSGTEGSTTSVLGADESTADIISTSHIELSHALSSTYDLSHSSITSPSHI